MASVLHPASAVALAIALSSGVAVAAQKLGVDVYPGATALDAKSAHVKATTGVAEAYCYRTSDAPDAVAAFVLKQAGFVAREQYVYRRQKVDVVIHPPAANPKTGAMSPTVFCIMTAKD
jgi:hypothetical protein